MQFKKGAFEVSELFRIIKWYNNFEKLNHKECYSIDFDIYSAYMHMEPFTSKVSFLYSYFQANSVIYPIAIRFDARFGDAFWWQDKFFHFILYMLTSWAIVCNVWYLPPMVRIPGESAIAFADR